MFNKSRNFGSKGLATPEQTAAIYEKMKKLSAADLSTLEAASRNIGASILTTEGSPNDQLWSAMQQVNWVARNSVPTSGFGADANPAKGFKILEAGREPISRLLKDLVAELARKPNDPRVLGMELSNDFILRLRQSVIDNGGGMRDFSSLIAFAVAQAAHRFVAPENKEAWISEISKMSKSMLERMEVNEVDRSSQ